MVAAVTNWKRPIAMKLTKLKKVLPVWSVIASAIALPFSALFAAESKADKPKPYPLQTCVVSGEKLGGDMGKPHVFTYQDREIKLCCQGCLKTFNKEPAKYIKKLEEAEKAKAKSDNATAKGHDGHRGRQH
jgi:hypothetical protein